MSVFGSTVLITGNESLLAERAVEARRAKALEEVPEAEVHHVGADELGDQMLSEVVGSSLFASHVIAIIDDVGACPTDVTDQLLAVARDPGPELALVLVHGGGNKGRGFVDKLRKARVEVQKVEAPKPWETWRFVAQEARHHRLRMGQETAEALVAAVGSDLRTVAAAVAQLELDTDRDEIDVALVRRYFAGRSEMSSFSVADAVLAGHPTLAFERLRWAIETGTAHVLVIAALAKNFRAMGKYLDAQGTRMSDRDMASRIGVPFFKVKDYHRYARQWDARGVAHAIERIAEGDAQVKGAATDADFALEACVLGVLAERRRSR
ncbi:DNA polymerase III subunit delta [uncultured Tessaracoccus sp.]|uniref:DNA polymerase III subunit delta n=1 Tax=uncultured Tessaracoccus sp. TaxID=905023 RepID=UPI0025FE6736|nr:DNA polymerase III subunit delta [uncultured Tessaracoccus sp.]